MLCPRCASIASFITKQEYVEYDNFIIVSKNEYYCQKCKSAMIETFRNSDFYSSEWIDFNG